MEEWGEVEQLRAEEVVEEVARAGEVEEAEPPEVEEGAALAWVEVARAEE